MLSISDCPDKDRASVSEGDAGNARFSPHLLRGNKDLVVCQGVPYVIVFLSKTRGGQALITTCIQKVAEINFAFYPTVVNEKWKHTKNKQI